MLHFGLNYAIGWSQCLMACPCQIINKEGELVDNSSLINLCTMCMTNSRVGVPTLGVVYCSSRFVFPIKMTYDNNFTCHTHLTRKFSNTSFLNLFHSWHFYVSFSNFPPMHNANAAPHYAHLNEILIKKHLKMEVNMLGQLGRVWVVHILYIYSLSIIYINDGHAYLCNQQHSFFLH